MEFNVFSITRKKGIMKQLHTPSCSHNKVLKTKWALYKITAPYVEDAKQIAATTTPIVVHEKCCRLFHKPSNTNPPCTHCQSPDTTLRGKLAPGRYEYACKACSKTFVIKKERIMKVRISKSGKAVAQKLTRDQRQAARAQRRADRLAARKQRREERKVKRIERIGIRLQRTAARLAKLTDDPQVELTNLIAKITGAASFVMPSKGTKRPKAKTAKKAAAKKAAPLKKVTYAPATNAPGQSAKKTSRRKK